MLSSENSSVALEQVRVTDLLDVKTGGSAGSFYGNVTLAEGATASVHTEVSVSLSWSQSNPSSSR